MLFATSTNVTVYAFYASGLTGKTGLTVKVSVNRNGTVISGLAVSDAVAATEVDATNQPGLYSYTLSSSNDATEGAYTFHFYTTDTTVNAQHIESLIYCFAWVGYINGAGGNLNSGKTGYSLSGTQTFNVTGNITGNLSGSVGSVLGNVAGSVASVVAFAQSALAQFFTSDSGEVYADAVDGSVVKEIAENSSGGGGSGDTSTFSGAAATQINAMETDIEAIKAKTDRLGEYNITFQSPTLDGGVLAITKGQTYNVDFNLDVEYTLPLTGPDPADWGDVILLIQTTGTPLPITAVDVNTTTGLCKWNLTPAQSESANGRNATIYVELLNGDAGDKWIPFNGTMNVTTTLVSSL